MTLAREPSRVALKECPYPRHHPGCTEHSLGHTTGFKVRRENHFCVFTLEGLRPAILFFSSLSRFLRSLACFLWTPLPVSLASSFRLRCSLTLKTSHCSSDGLSPNSVKSFKHTILASARVIFRLYLQEPDGYQIDFSGQTKHSDNDPGN